MNPHKYISHIVIAEQILGLKKAVVLRMANTGIWGTTYKPTSKVVMVEVAKLEQWISKHQLKKAA